MMRASLIALLVLAVPTATPADDTPTPSDPYVFDGVARVVAVGDVHGSYGRLAELLHAAGLIDEATHWVGGETHLVMVGDLIDRNPGDRQVLDLLRRLQQESGEAGGQVHVLLGNHEVMNLLRDLRYVAPGSHREFVEFEKPGDRRRAEREYLHQNRDRRRKEVSEEFERVYPPGYFGRLAAFDLDGPYGRWLVKRPVVVRINGVLYVHGGLTEAIAAMGLRGINDGIREELVEHLENRAILGQQGLVDDLMDYPAIIAKAVAIGRDIPPTLPWVRRAAEAVLHVVDSPLFGGEGPLWYRGNANEDERIERARLQAALESLGARAMVVAHSPTPDSNITSRFAGKLYRVDHGLSKGNHPLALVLEGNSVEVLDANRGTLSAPALDTPLGRGWADATSRPVQDEAIAEILREGQVESVRELGRGSTHPLLLELELNGAKLRAVFKSVQEGSGGGRRTCDRYQHEVAAYLIDRRLGFGLVPVTVLRRLDGTKGSAQEFIEDAVDQLSVEAYRLEPLDPELLRRQLAEARVFDMLIGNPERKPTDILYAPGDGGLRLIDHSKAFCAGARIRRGDTPLEIEPGLREALAGLDDAWAALQLGHLLDEQEIAALLERRDLLLERSEPGGADAGRAEP